MPDRNAQLAPAIRRSKSPHEWLIMQREFQLRDSRRSYASSALGHVLSSVWSANSVQLMERCEHSLKVEWAGQG